MPSFDFVQTIVSAFVLVFLLANIVLHIIDRFKEGFEGETVAPATSQIDYASQISTDMSEIFEKVNKQMEITKTIKIPISTDTVTISYNRDVPNAQKMQIYVNLLTLMNDGVMRVEQDLKNVQTYQYIGNDSVQNMADELAKITEATVSTKCGIVESFEDMTATSAPIPPSAPISTDVTTAPTYSASVTSCLRKNEYEMIQRVKVIVDSHQKTIDKILEKRASA